MATNPKLQVSGQNNFQHIEYRFFIQFKEVKRQAYELMKLPPEILPGSFNLSDLRADKTMYFDSPQNSISNQFKSPFKASEISARSTALNLPVRKFEDTDFDEIMRTSVSADVRNKYRESIGMGRLSSMPRTADVSLRSTNGEPQKANESFWGPGNVYASRFKGQNQSMQSEEFRPAEEMTEKMRTDERDQEQEYATIPNIDLAESSSWEDRTKRQPEVSFGAYCKPFLFNSSDVFGEKPIREQRNDRVAMVDVEMEDELMSIKNCNIEGLQKWLSKLIYIFVVSQILKFNSQKTLKLRKRKRK